MTLEVFDEKEAKVTISTQDAYVALLKIDELGMNIIFYNPIQVLLLKNVKKRVILNCTDKQYYVLKVNLL